jgi:hypothetical protein
MLHVLPLFLALGGPAAIQQPPPATPPAKAQTAPAQAVKRVPPPPYNEKADAKAAIETAIQAAATDDIRVLINWGANDDPGSMKFADARRAPELTQTTFFSDEYKVVTVDVGHLDKNLDLAKTYGAKLSADALPALTVLDGSGKVLANTTAAALRPDGDVAAIDAAKVTAFLTKYQAPAPDAVAPFEAAVKQAKRDGKSVFVWFSAPW